MSTAPLAVLLILGLYGEELRGPAGLTFSVLLCVLLKNCGQKAPTRYTKTHARESLCPRSLWIIRCQSSSDDLSASIK